MGGSATPSRRARIGVKARTCLGMLRHSIVELLGVSYTEQSKKARHRQGTQQTGITYSQPKRPSTGTAHRPSPGTAKEQPKSQVA